MDAQDKIPESVKQDWLEITKQVGISGIKNNDIQNIINGIFKYTGQIEHFSDYVSRLTGKVLEENEITKIINVTRDYYDRNSMYPYTSYLKEQHNINLSAGDVKGVLGVASAFYNNKEQKGQQTAAYENSENDKEKREEPQIIQTNTSAQQTNKYDKILANLEAKCAAVDAAQAVCMKRLADFIVEGTDGLQQTGEDEKLSNRQDNTLNFEKVLAFEEKRIADGIARIIKKEQEALKKLEKDLDGFEKNSEEYKNTAKVYQAKKELFDIDVLERNWGDELVHDAKCNSVQKDDKVKETAHQDMMKQMKLTALQDELELRKAKEFGKSTKQNFGGDRYRERGQEEIETRKKMSDKYQNAYMQRGGLISKLVNGVSNNQVSMQDAAESIKEFQKTNTGFDQNEEEQLLSKYSMEGRVSFDDMKWKHGGSESSIIYLLISELGAKPENKHEKIKKFADAFFGGDIRKAEQLDGFVTRKYYGTKPEDIKYFQNKVKNGDKSSEYLLKHTVTTLDEKENEEFENILLEMGGQSCKRFDKQNEQEKKQYPPAELTL